MASKLKPSTNHVNRKRSFDGARYNFHTTITDSEQSEIVEAIANNKVHESNVDNIEQHEIKNIGILAPQKTIDIEYMLDKYKPDVVVLQKMELGEPDASGRRSPVPIPGATITLDIDMAIVAVGVSPNPIVPKSIAGLELGRKNTIVVNDNMQSSVPFLFAGGDIVRGGATVILAMGDGRRAAAAMDKYLSK